MRISIAGMQHTCDVDYDFVQKQKVFDLVEIRVGLLFHPNKHYVAELQEKDYLGKAKVSADSLLRLLHYCK